MHRCSRTAVAKTRRPLRFGHHGSRPARTWYSFRSNRSRENNSSQFREHRYSNSWPAERLGQRQSSTLATITGRIILTASRSPMSAATSKRYSARRSKECCRGNAQGAPLDAGREDPKSSRTLAKAMQLFSLGFGNSCFAAQWPRQPSGGIADSTITPTSSRVPNPDNPEELWAVRAFGMATAGGSVLYPGSSWLGGPTAGCSVVRSLILRLCDFCTALSL